MLFGGVMKTCLGVYFFPRHSVQVVSKANKNPNIALILNDLLVCNCN